MQIDIYIHSNIIHTNTHSHIHIHACIYKQNGINDIFSSTKIFMSFTNQSLFMKM